MVAMLNVLRVIDDNCERAIAGRSMLKEELQRQHETAEIHANNALHEACEEFVSPVKFPAITAVSP